MQEPHKLLGELGLSDSEVNVYLAMVSGARSARDLLKVTRMKRPTIYYALGCLEKRGLVSKSGKAGDKNFNLEKVDKLKVLAEERALESNQLKENIAALIPSLANKSSPADNRPTVAFFEGVDAVKSTIMDMLYCKGKQINSLVPKENFFWQVGPDFVELYIEERVKRRIRTKNLWETPINKDLIKKYYESLSEVRIIPKIMWGKFDTTIFLYDDKTLYVSSKKNSYCVLITSAEHHDTMQAIFDGLWSVSVPH